MVGRAEYESDLRSAMGSVSGTDIEVERVRLRAGRAVVLPRERQSCRFRDASGKMHFVHVTGQARSLWARTPQGYLQER